MAGRGRSACGIVATMLMAICPVLGAAQIAAEPMAALDLQFDQKKAVEIPRLLKRIGDRSRAEAAQARAKRRNQAALAELRKKTEESRLKFPR